jgi:hypothetical protein
MEIKEKSKGYYVIGYKTKSGRNKYLYTVPVSDKDVKIFSHFELANGFNLKSNARKVVKDLRQSKRFKNKDIQFFLVKAITNYYIWDRR